MSDYINESAESFNEEPQKKGFTFAKLIKWLFLSLIILVYLILAARCVQSSDHKIVDKILVNVVFVKAYENSPEEFSVEKYGIEKAWDDIREGRLLEFNNLYYVPLAKQLQISVKFNLDLPLCEYEEEIPFRFRLRDDEGVEYTDYWYEFAEKTGYGYIRLCFEGIELEKPEEENAVEIAGEAEETQTSIGSYGVSENRKKYTLCVDMINADGSYSEISATRIYGGSVVSKKIDFVLERAE